RLPAQPRQVISHLERAEAFGARVPGTDGTGVPALATRQVRRVTEAGRGFQGCCTQRCTHGRGLSPHLSRGVLPRVGVGTCHVTTSPPKAALTSSDARST